MQLAIELGEFCLGLNVYMLLIEILGAMLTDLCIWNAVKDNLRNVQGRDMVPKTHGRHN